VDYIAADQVRAATEIEVLPEGIVVLGMLGDYAVLCEQVKACR
jgi:hypothetical protein